jgi:DNA primase
VYEEALWGARGAHALAYLRGRGLTDETIRRFRLGYAPPGNYLKSRMVARGVGEFCCSSQADRAGERGRESFDFFRDRVLFPILDLRGRPVAFGGRVMGDGEPKYLNSADTPLFHKGKQLYGLSLAREAAAAAGAITVVEGYMDVIAMAQAGIENTVAPLGTALTETQLALLWRYAAEPVLCFDNDKAGRAAALRAANRALPAAQARLSLLFAQLPAGKDPDDICRA